ncbi:MAG: response regulator transcription factor [Planctomycetes bacterium]|nr:response regulator transcription factor [Planctomycetota bacterium]
MSDSVKDFSSSPVRQPDAVTPNATVFVVEDQPELQRLWLSLIASTGLSVEGFSSAQEFLGKYDPNRPGCLVLDIGLPGMSGLELLEKLTAQGVPVSVIVITGLADVQTTVRAMKAGAFDLLPKPVPNDVLLERIRAALGRDVQKRDERARVIAIRSRLDRLSRRERQVMDLVVNGFANKQIAVRLDLSEKTIEAHRTHLMRKMEAHSLAELVRLVMTAQHNREES